MDEEQVGKPDPEKARRLQEDAYRRRHLNYAHDGWGGVSIRMLPVSDLYNYYRDHLGPHGPVRTPIAWRLTFEEEFEIEGRPIRRTVYLLTLAENCRLPYLRWIPTLARVFDGLPGIGLLELYELHGQMCLARGAALGLLKSTMGRPTKKGIRLARRAYKAGWRPNKRLTVAVLAIDFAPAVREGSEEAAADLVELLSDNVAERQTSGGGET